MMMKALFTLKKTKKKQQFKEFYTDWVQNLKSNLLPQLKRSMASSNFCPLQLSSQVDLIHGHFQSLYGTLDLAASHDASQVLYPEWRNSLEKGFIWMGDFHPGLFTNLLRSFLEDEDEEVDVIGRLEFTIDRPMSVVNAWKSHGKKEAALMGGIQQIECGIRLIVPSLVSRMRDAQARVVEKVGAEWGEKGKGGGNDDEVVEEGVGKAMVEAMEELTCVFLDANRLRRSVLSEIVAVLDVYQGALFLEGLAEFVVGFRDPELLPEFARTKMLRD